MVTQMQIDIPRAWEQLTLTRLHGTLLVIGAPDTGKSTFAQYLYRCLAAELGRVAYVDGDPGQSNLGPPATLTLAVNNTGHHSFPPQGQHWRSFVGAVSPRGHMLPLIIGAARLVHMAQAAESEVIIYDTTGLIDPAQGGTALKLAKIDLLRPTVVFALQQSRELEPLLIPLRRSRRVRVVDIPPSPARQLRDRPTRQAHRAAQFARYFANAQPLPVDWRRLAVLPSPRFIVNRLVALEDVAGFTRGLALVRQTRVSAGQVILQTPLDSLAEIDTLRLGDLVLDPQSFRDQRLAYTETQPG